MENRKLTSMITGLGAVVPEKILTNHGAVPGREFVNDILQKMERRLRIMRLMQRDWHWRMQIFRLKKLK